MKRALVIDDHEPSRQNLVGVLAENGFQIVGAATSGAAGLQLASASAPDVILMSDANAAYKSFARQAHIRHEVIHLSQNRRVPGAVHIQNVNAYHGRFQIWLRHFNGVATHRSCHQSLRRRNHRASQTRRRDGLSDQASAGR